MRKISSALYMMVAVMAAIMFSLTGCSSDDDKTESSSGIVGKWKYVSSVPGMEEGDVLESDEIEFKADGTFVGFYDNNDRPTSAKWTQKDANSVTVAVDIFPLPMTWPIVKLEGNTLILKMTDYDSVDENGNWSGGTTYTVTFERIN